MALIAYLKYSNDILGTTTTETAGDEDVTDHSEIYHYRHKIYSPIDLNTGAVQGARVHGPLQVTKPVDAATAPLYQALCIGQTLDELVLKFFQVSSADGTLVMYWTITMTNAKVSSIVPELPNVKDEALLNVPLMEDVEFLYEEIMWEHVVESMAYVDVWSQGA